MFAPCAIAAAEHGWPSPIEKVAPMYPRAAYLKHIEGCVRASFTVDQKGRASGFKVEQSEPGKLFNEVTLKALRKWRFEPSVPPVHTEQVITYRMTQPGPIGATTDISCNKDSQWPGLLILP